MTGAGSGWIETLEPRDRVLAHVASRAYELLEVVGGCYFVTFFLHKLLKTELAIETEPIVGWVCDDAKRSRGLACAAQE